MTSSWTILASTDAACRWWRVGDDLTTDCWCVKGTINLVSTTSTKYGREYFITYKGDWDCGNQEGAAKGMFPLPPPSSWVITATKFKSANSKARAIAIEFCHSGDHSSCISKLQITIPFNGNDGSAGKVFIQGFQSVAHHDNSN